MLASKISSVLLRKKNPPLFASGIPRAKPVALKSNRSMSLIAFVRLGAQPGQHLSKLRKKCGMQFCLTVGRYFQQRGRWLRMQLYARTAWRAGRKCPAALQQMVNYIDRKGAGDSLMANK